MTTPARTWTTVVAATLALASAGCGDDDPATAAAAAEGAPTVEVTLVDFAFEGLPDTVAAGTRLTVSNASESELHELVAFAVPEGEDRPAAELAALPPDELLPLVGEPATVLMAAPGGDQIPAVGDGTLDEPGRYAVLCLIPTGIDPQTYLDAAAAGGDEGPPEVDGGGPPHVVHGMVADLVVE